MNQDSQSHLKLVIKTYPFRGISIDRGDGNYLYDTEGNSYLDCISGYGSAFFGYNHPTITKSIAHQLKTLPTLHGSFANPIRTQAAQKLNELCGGKYQTYFSNSGAEAVEAAMKFAVTIQKSKHFITFKNAYHGKTLGALSLNGTKKYTKNFEPLLWSVTHVTYGNKSEFIKALTPNTTAVIVEPIQGESGIVSPPPGYLSFIREQTQKNNILLITDEIQTGMGRTGKFLCTQWEDIDADIICLGKSLGGGIPAGATLVHKKYSLKIPKGAQTSTLGGNPLAASGINATLSLLTKKTLKDISTKGKYFLSELKQNLGDHPQVTSIRGMGLMVGVQVGLDQSTILKKLQQGGILAGPAGEDVIRFLPPMTITKKEIDKVVKLLSKILTTNHV